MVERSVNQQAGGGPNPTPSLQDLRIEIIPNKLGDELARTYHYLHRARTGRRLTYGVFLGGELEGFITYAYPATQPTAVPGVPGDKVLELARLFLHRNIPNMASRVIGLTRRWVRRDWVRGYPSTKVPRCIVSWSDTTRYEGTIYKAAGFVFSGFSQSSAWGKRRTSGDRKNHTDIYHLKKRWIYWFEETDEQLSQNDSQPGCRAAIKRGARELVRA